MHYHGDTQEILLLRQTRMYILRPLAELDTELEAELEYMEVLQHTTDTGLGEVEE